MISAPILHTNMGSVFFSFEVFFRMSWNCFSIFSEKASKAKVKSFMKREILACGGLKLAISKQWCLMVVLNWSNLGKMAPGPFLGGSFFIFWKVKNTAWNPLASNQRGKWFFLYNKNWLIPRPDFSIGLVTGGKFLKAETFSLYLQKQRFRRKLTLPWLLDIPLRTADNFCGLVPTRCWFFMSESPNTHFSSQWAL